MICIGMTQALALMITKSFPLQLESTCHALRESLILIRYPVIDAPLLTGKPHVIARP
jgi:hypothetical protein